MSAQDRPLVEPAQEARAQILRRIADAPAPREPQLIADVVARIIAEVGPRRARRRRPEGGGE